MVIQASFERNFLLQDTELVAAGFPCVDVSRAGLRAGLDGKSTGLVRHVFRLLQTSINAGHPVPWVLLENVEVRAAACLPRHFDEGLQHA
jgi:site-specific DNA-cytosine methylase